MARLVDTRPTVLSKADATALRRLFGVIDKASAIIGDGKPFQTYHSLAYERRAGATIKVIERARKLVQP